MCERAINSVDLSIFFLFAINKNKNKSSFAACYPCSSTFFLERLQSRRCRSFIGSRLEWQIEKLKGKDRYIRTISPGFSKNWRSSQRFICPLAARSSHRLPHYLSRSRRSLLRSQLHFSSAIVVACERKWQDCRDCNGVAAKMGERHRRCKETGQVLQLFGETMQLLGGKRCQIYIRRSPLLIEERRRRCFCHRSQLQTRSCRLPLVPGGL